MQITAGIRLVLGLLLVGATLPAGSPAHADSEGGVLPMPAFARLLADEAHGQLLLSPGPEGTGVEVTDLHGVHVTTVEGLPGATGLALTPDGAGAWVALPAAGQLARVDTATLTVTQRLSVPEGRCPEEVAVTADRLVYGYTTCGGNGWGGVAVLDPSTGTEIGVVRDPFVRAVLAVGPAGQVYASDAGLSSATLYHYDVSGDAPVQLASAGLSCVVVWDLAASADGQQVTPVCGYPYQHGVYSADRFAHVMDYPSGAFPGAAAWSGDGRTFVGGATSSTGTDVRVFRVGDPTPVRLVDFGTRAALHRRGLAVSRSGERVWAAVDTGAGPAVRVLQGAGSAITLAAEPPAVDSGSSATLVGRVTSDGAGVAGVSLTVTRRSTDLPPSDGPELVRLPDVVTDADGRFTSTDRAGLPDTYTYEVSWAGDAGRAGSHVTTSLLVRPHATTLTTSAPTSSYVGRSVRVTGQLTSAGTALPGAAVQVTRSGCTDVRWRGTATTGAEGRWSVSDPAPPVGTCTYRAVAPGRAAYATSRAADSTSVVRRPAALTLSVVRGTGDHRRYVYVTGQLGAWHTNRTVTLTARPSGGTTVVLARGVVDSRGTLRARYRPRTTTTYRLTYAGDGWYRPGVVSRTR